MAIFTFNPSKSYKSLVKNIYISLLGKGLAGETGGKETNGET